VRVWRGAAGDAGASGGGGEAKADGEEREGEAVEEEGKESLEGVTADGGERAGHRLRDLQRDLQGGSLERAKASYIATVVKLGHVVVVSGERVEW
jgi:hypothetical protein